MEYDNVMFTLIFFYNPDYKTHMWYVEKKTTEIKQSDRVITNHQITGQKITGKLIPLSDGERKIFAYLNDKTKICYSDNLTGTVFNTILDKFK